MQTKRFVAADMRRALSLVRDDLGEDAMILSTERTTKGVEIIATAEEMPPQPNANKEPQAYSVPAKPQRQEQPSQENEGARSGIGLASGKTQQELAQELEGARRRMLAMQQSQKDDMTITEWADRETAQSKQLSEKNRAISAEKTKATESIVAAKNAERENGEIQKLHEEIASMRNLFENQLMAMSVAQERQFQEQKNNQEIIPIAAQIKQKLSKLGLTQACNDQVIRSLRMVDDKSMDEPQLWKESLARLSRSIPTVTNDPVATGGIYAFLGTTGVGKTTTIAKLAARYVMEHGSEQVALLTTDTFRIGAHDQLRSLGRILNVQVNVVDNLEQLPEILKKFHKQALILIDTPGMSYNDPLLNAHLSALRQCQHVQTGLVLSANSQYQMMQATLHSYRIAKPRFCVMTKLDECASLGDAISLLATNELPLAYITDGQTVPDDLSILKPHQLVAKAVSLSRLHGADVNNESPKLSSKNPA